MASALPGRAHRRRRNQGGLGPEGPQPTAGYVFESQTDTEVIAHLVHHHYQGDLLDAVQQAVPRLRGAFAIAVFCRDEPQRVVGARQGSPLVLGVGTGGRAGEHFLASDPMALAGVTDQIVYLDEGDVVDLQIGKHWVSARDAEGRWKPAQRAVRTVQAHSGAAELGPYRHYMQKEIFEQPKAIADTLDGVHAIGPELFGDGAHRVFKAIDRVLILACGTSSYAGMAARQWIETLAGLPAAVEIGVACELIQQDHQSQGRQGLHRARHPGRIQFTSQGLRDQRAEARADVGIKGVVLPEPLRPWQPMRRVFRRTEPEIKHRAGGFRNGGHGLLKVCRTRPTHFTAATGENQNGCEQGACASRILVHHSNVLAQPSKASV